jgi:hypothetical protein
MNLELVRGLNGGATYENTLVMRSSPATGGSHAGSHTDEQPSGAPDSAGQPEKTSRRSRTVPNGIVSLTTARAILGMASRRRRAGDQVAWLPGWPVGPTREVELSGDTRYSVRNLPTRELLDAVTVR